MINFVSLTIAPAQFDLAPELVIGGFIRVDLHGRHQQQPGDDLFYQAIESVSALGKPIGALWQLEGK